ncbi:MAG: SPOR domain-containing protein [Proteobacteria bacterium]|nr:SPOR domain-containing protein [Pseudomonadota bacterium]
MTRRKRKRSTKKRQQHEYPGWVWMLFGLGVGLSVALAIFMKDRGPGAAVREPLPVPASLASAIDYNDESATASAEEPPERRFDFYNMLPNFEVIIPEQEPDVSRDREPKAIERPGIYVLQAGSFTQYVDADRRRAQLALQGIESRIQRVTIDDKTYHRVRIGPTRDLDELNALRSRLRQAKIDVLRIRLGD